VEVHEECENPVVDRAPDNLVIAIRSGAWCELKRGRRRLLFEPCLTIEVEDLLLENS
jgi:hypothetical protein